MSHSKIYNAFLVLIGIVLGSFVSGICRGVSFLSWLAFGVNFGTESPVVLDLGILSLTFGIAVNLTLATVIFIILSLLIGRAIAR